MGAILASLASICVAGLFVQEENTPRVKDPWFFPTVGYEAQYLGPVRRGLDGFAAVDFLALAEYDKFLRARDTDGMEDMLNRGRIVPVEFGARLHLIKEHNYEVIDEPSSWEARIKEGARDGLKVFVRHAEVGRLNRLPVQIGETAKLAPLKRGEPVPVFTSARACQDFIDAYRAKESNRREFTGTVNMLKNENEMILASSGKPAVVVRIEVLRDDIAAIRDPDGDGTLYFTITTCLAK